MFSDENGSVKTVHEFLMDEKNRNELKKSLKILRLIWDLHKKNLYPTLKSLIRHYYKDTYPVMGTKKEQHSFFRGKKPGMSRWLKFLKNEMFAIPGLGPVALKNMLRRETLGTYHIPAVDD